MVRNWPSTAKPRAPARKRIRPHSGAGESALARARSSASLLARTTPAPGVEDGSAEWTCREFAITATYPAAPGIARVVLRAALAADQAQEERNLDALDVEFDAGGNYVPPRPNAPGLDQRTLAVSEGLRLRVRGVYDATGERGAAVELRLFARAPDGGYDYGTPAATAALVVSAPRQVKTALLDAVLPAAGWRYLRALAATADGVLSHPDQAPEYLIYASDHDMPAPAGVEACLGRG